MLKMFQYALVVCSAIATFAGGAHIIKTYGDFQLTAHTKALIAADAASKAPVITTTETPVGE
jgi:hypothetical protein